MVNVTSDCLRRFSADVKWGVFLVARMAMMTMNFLENMLVVVIN